MRRLVRIVPKLAILNGKFRIPICFLERIAIENPEPLRYNVGNHN